MLNYLNHEHIHMNTNKYEIELKSLQISIIYEKVKNKIKGIIATTNI